MEFTSLWDGAGDAAQAAADDRALAMAKAACMGFLPFLAGAQTEREYVHREALAEEKITLAAEVAGITTVALAQALKADWDMVAEARRATAGERRSLTMPHSEVAMHMNIAGKPMHGEHVGHGMVQLYEPDSGKPFSFPITEGEAGWREGTPHEASAEPPPFSVEPKVSGRHDPVAYTYEADMHCPDCAKKRFGTDEHGDITGIDGEGNEVGAVAPWDEMSPEGEHCGTCGREISEPYKTGSRKVRRLAIVHVAGFPPTDGDDDGKADMDGDGQDDDDPNAVAPQSTGYYVLDEDSNLDIGGPYASKADASDAIDAGVFDADPEGVTVQKGTVAENGGGDVDPNAAPDADPQDDGSGDVDPDADTTGAGGNPFAKGAARLHQCARCGHEWEATILAPERCPACGALLPKEGSLKTQANPYTDDNPYTDKDNGPDETSPLAGGADQTDAPGGSMTTKPRQLPSGGAPPTVPAGSNTPQNMGGDARGTNIPPGL